MPFSTFRCLSHVIVCLSSGYHPQSNGQTECLNQELERFLRSHCQFNQDDWGQLDLDLTDHIQHVQYSVHVHFLGYIIGPNGISMDPVKIQAIHPWPQPITLKDLQCFLGFSNFHSTLLNQPPLLFSPSFLLSVPSSGLWTNFLHELNFNLKTIVLK